VTSVPTWLAVLGALAAVLADLIAGFVALLGVRLGGQTARQPAEHTASLARQDEQRRWNRERRYAAYAAFLEARDRYVEAQMAFGSARETWERFDRKRDIRAEQQRAEDSWEELQKALPQVELVGTPDARHFARSWVEKLRARYAEAYATGEFYTQGTREIARDDTEKRREAFVALIRRELEVDG
jgi:hypothetical protein